MFVFSGGSQALSFDVGDTEASVYGYVKLDAIYDVGENTGNNINHGNIRVDGEPQVAEGHARLIAEQSRLGFATETMVKGSALKTKVEGDFWGGDFRLRHAYGQWGNLLIGQTWTNFTGMTASPPKVAFFGFGSYGSTKRHAQIRYTTGPLSVALENPTTGWTGNVDAGGDEKSGLPDVTARYSKRSGSIRYTAATVARYLEYDDAVASQDDNTIGWGVSFETAMDVNEVLTLRAGVSHGDGVGGYIDTPPTSSPAFRQANGDLETIELTGGTLSLTADVGVGSFTLAYFRTVADLDDMPGAARMEDARDSLLANYIWSPVQNVSYGIEAGLHSRELVDGSDGDAVRLQAMAKYSF